MMIGIDIDGVVADVHPTVAEFCMERHGFTFNPATDIITWNQKFDKGVDMNTLIREFFKCPEWVAKVKPIPGAREGVEKLAEEHHVVFITQRRCMPETEAWIKLHMGDFPVLFAKDTKTVFNFDMLIDDRCRNIEDVLAIGRKGILMAMPYNLEECVQNIIHRPGADVINQFFIVKDWDDIMDIAQSF